MQRLWCIVSLATLTLASCSRTKTGAVGVTPDTIRVGMIGDLSGPLAFLGQEISAGARLYFQHVSDQGGIHGRKIKFLVEDDGYQPPRTLAACRKLLDRDQVLCLIGTVGTATTLAIEPVLQNERVPLVAPMTWSSVVYDPPRRYIFGFGATYRMQSWVILNYIRDNFRDVKPRIGVVYQDDDFGQDGLKGVREAAAYYGLDLAAAEGYKRGATDFSTQLLNLKRAKATHVILWTVLREAAAVLKEARQLDWRPRFLGNHTFADDKIVELAGEAARNLLVLTFGDVWAGTQRMTFYREVNRRYTPSHTPRMLHAGGFVVAQGLVEALKRAGKDVNREKLVEAAESFREWDENVFGTPLTYGPDQRISPVTQLLLARADVAQKRLVADPEPIRFRMPADWSKVGRKD